ncbi:hypothetical protein [Halomarina litorea]|uniref:hypothetical protein n=1 Tax=Halomarina litorea TaxID=2961595 RepID=UPI0020C58292|nr:hypothetical protein [Halomarina sp. BCD28]
MESHSSFIRLCGLVLIGVLVVSASLPAASFTQGEASRGANLNVVGDTNGALKINSSKSVYINDTSDLVTITNHLGRDVTITVTLRNDSIPIGDISAGSVNYSNETTFTVAQGTAETVQIKIPDDSSLTDEIVYFHITASAPGLTVKALDREVQVNA